MRLQTVSSPMSYARWRLNTEMAWSLFIAGFTDTAFARRRAARFRAGPIEVVHFAEGEVTGIPFAEFFAYGSNPAAALAAVAASRPPQRHYLTVRPPSRLSTPRGYQRACSAQV